MLKEIIISILIIVFVIIGNIMTQNYTKKCIGEIDKELIALREELINEGNQAKEDLQNKINTIHSKWDDINKRFAFYIEHDELEKVETQLTSVRGNIDMESYDQSVPELDKCIYILNHIKDKEALKIQNIF